MMRRGSAFFVTFIAFLAGTGPAAEPADELAGSIDQASGVDAGMALVIDDADGNLTAALAKGSRLTVQGCSWDGKKVQALRSALLVKSPAERTSIALIEADGLPYADNLINLLVSAAWGSRPLEIAEVLRVLAPGGTGIVGNDAKPAAMDGLEAKLRQAGVTDIKALARKGWLQFVKPVDPGLGSWTHLSGGADMSYVNDDKVLGPWEEIRWIGDPRWGALYMTYGGVVTAGGRIYYKENRAANGGRQSFLVARDAYNGLELWRVPCGSVWKTSYIWSDTSLTCDQRLVYIVEDKNLVARDGRTGKKLREYAPGFLPATATSSGTTLLASDKSRAAAMDQASGKALWSRPCIAHPAVTDGMAFVPGPTDLEAVDLVSGASRWKTKVESAAPNASSRVFCKAGVVYVTHAPAYKPVASLAAFDAKSGKLLWKKEQTTANYGIFPYQDDLWLLTKSQGKADNVSAQIVESRTGKTKKEFAAKGSVWAHCDPTKGSANYLLYDDSWYLDVRSGTTYGLKTVRTPCQLGHCPANGLTYFLPHHCNCGMSLRGFLAMAKAGGRKWLTGAAKDGNSPLYSSAPAPSGAAEKADDWPMYRKDARRSNATAAKLPGQLAPLWSETLGTSRLIQATVANGLIYTAEPRTHLVFARDAASGREVWSFVADGRVEYPPALHKGLCLFGTSGGTVYCLDAKTGGEIWRLRAAPAQKYIAEEGQFASTWPVIGGVMPLDGTIYFTCGRAAAAEGLWLMAVDADTGKIRWRNRGGTTGDLFASDGKKLFLTASSYGIADGKLAGSGVAKNVLQTTTYSSAISIADYMACIEPALANQKHNSLTDGSVSGENLAFNDKLGVAAYRYCYHMPAAMKKKDKEGQLYIYAAAEGKNRWLLDEHITQQMVGVALAGDTAYLAGLPVSQDPKDKSELWVLSGADGKKLQTLTLDARPVYDGLSAAGGRLYLATEDGKLICFGAK